MELIRETKALEADIVIAGGGQSGLSAALTAVESGKTIIIFEKLHLS